ncbi:hypothetical protein ELQ35_12500 [Peribacillus cavernae]|uniref:Uncharacterized protein n=1 Tax=Peribacillus cavernae TaxID=1674310 RepID=A0A3S0U038_9BACI|nr:hypothetical protein [Peribacillus cavernae]MDQ0218319.1 hypothetical protein [Peribacillus cavernae]RUQ28399.1 hypothetical protein ELQ35_12500 [Peribacillus cavernae]
MKRVFATELRYGPDEFPDLYMLLESQVGIIDHFGSFLITGSKKEADFCQEVAAAADAFVEIHCLLQHADTKPLELFSDYGFKTEAAAYLFKQGLACFQFASGGKTERKMPLLEMEEVLIASLVVDSENFFFIDFFQKDLVCGIAKAYGVEAVFLHLDK